MNGAITKKMYNKTKRTYYERCKRILGLEITKRASWSLLHHIPIWSCRLKNHKIRLYILPYSNLRSRRLEVVGERENGRPRDFPRTRFFLCPLLPSASYAGYSILMRECRADVRGIGKPGSHFWSNKSDIVSCSFKQAWRSLIVLLDMAPFECLPSLHTLNLVSWSTNNCSQRFCFKEMMPPPSHILPRSPGTLWLRFCICRLLASLFSVSWESRKGKTLSGSRRREGRKKRR